MRIDIAPRSNLEVAIKSFRKRTQKESLIKEARVRKAYEKPSVRKKRRRSESIERRIKIKKGIIPVA